MADKSTSRNLATWTILIALYASAWITGIFYEWNKFTAIIIGVAAPTIAGIVGALVTGVFRRATPHRRPKQKPGNSNPAIIVCDGYNMLLGDRRINFDVFNNTLLVAEDVTVKEVEVYMLAHESVVKLGAKFGKDDKNK